MTSSEPIGMSVAAEWSGWPSHDAVEEVLDRSDRSEQGAQPAVVEVPERPSPAVLGGDEARDQTTHAAIPPAYECIHRPSTSPPSSGITFAVHRVNFVDKPVVATCAPPVHFVLPEGAGRTARPVRGAILGTVPGTGFAGRKACERGTRRRPGTTDLFVAAGPVERRSPPVPSGAFVRSTCEDGTRPPCGASARLRACPRPGTRVRPDPHARARTG